MSKSTASYLAGFIDGEGYITLKRNNNKNRVYYVPTIKIASTDEWIIEWIQKSYGGHYYERKHQNKNHKDSYYWTLTGKNLKPFLQKIYPYLKLKKTQCGLVLSKIKMQETLIKGLPYPQISKINSKREDKRKINLSYREEYHNKIKAIYDKLRQLNKRGV